MAILSWGKPKIEVGTTADGTPATVFTEFPEVKENTAKLGSTRGDKKEAKGEGGEIIDTRYQKNNYAFECEVFIKKGATKPIVDDDGLISDHYTIRLTPEDATVEGWIMDKTTVSIEDVWSSEEGTMVKYFFDGLKPASGKILKPYTPA